jgi:hypothetical protein
MVPEKNVRLRLISTEISFSRHMDDRETVGVCFID